VTELHESAAQLLNIHSEQVGPMKRDVGCKLRGQRSVGLAQLSQPHLQGGSIEPKLAVNRGR